MTQNDAKDIIRAYNGGGVPRKELIANLVVGREDLLNAIKEVLDDTAQGGSCMKFLIGDSGFGKTCIMYLTMMSSWAKGFVTMSADFSSDRRLYDSGAGKALALYKALMDSVAIKTRPNGGALPLILEIGINNIISDLAVEKGLEKAQLLGGSNMELILDEIDKRLQNVDGIDSADYNSVVKSYFQGFIHHDTALKTDAVNWLSGCCKSLMEARQKLGVRKVIDDSNWYGMIKNFCAYAVHVAHFKGLSVMLDEAARICDITGKDIRDKNIEKILFIYNDCFQHRCDHMYIMMTGTVNFRENKSRGLCSNEHLRRRVEENEFLKDGLIDYSGSVFPLGALRKDSSRILFERLKTAFDACYETDLPITKDDIKTFVDSIYNTSSNPAFLSPAKVATKFLDLMELMRQNNLSFAEALSL